MIREYDYLVKLIKDIAIQQQEHKQQLFGSPKTHVPHFKLQEYTQERSNFIKKYFFESIPNDKVNPEKIRQNNQRFNNINNIEEKLTHFQIYPETELACKYNTPPYKTQYSEKKVHCSQVSNGNKNRLDHESFYQSNIEKLQHLSPEDCKNEINRLKLTTNKGTNQKLVNIQIFPDSAHQAELERY